MNIASLMSPPRPTASEPVPGRLQLVRVQAIVLLQGAVSSAGEGLKAFRHMRDVLTGAYAQART